jgi:hypothetical protein
VQGQGGAMEEGVGAAAAVPPTKSCVAAQSEGLLAGDEKAPETHVAACASELPESDQWLGGEAGAGEAPRHASMPLTTDMATRLSRGVEAGVATAGRQGGAPGDVAHMELEMEQHRREEQEGGGEGDWGGSAGGESQTPFPLVLLEGPVPAECLDVGTGGIDASAISVLLLLAFVPPARAAHFWVSSAVCWLATPRVMANQ